jgi:hypothetical protein
MVRNEQKKGLYLVRLPLVQQYLFKFERMEQLPKLDIYFNEEIINKHESNTVLDTGYLTQQHLKVID